MVAGDGKYLVELFIQRVLLAVKGDPGREEAAAAAEPEVITAKKEEAEEGEESGAAEKAREVLMKRDKQEGTD